MTYRIGSCILMSSFLDKATVMRDVRKYDLLFACCLLLPLLAAFTGLLPWSAAWIPVAGISGGWVVLRARIGKGT